jgi:hypothetical protein
VATGGQAFMTKGSYFFENVPTPLSGEDYIMLSHISSIMNTTIQQNFGRFCPKQKNNQRR